MNPAELIAQNFHATYETLAPEHGYETRKASAVAWDNVPDNNKALMIATVQNMLDMGIINPGPLARHVISNAPARVPSRVQARDEPCADPANCDVHRAASAPKSVDELDFRSADDPHADYLDEPA